MNVLMALLSSEWNFRIHLHAFRERFHHPHPVTLPWQEKRLGKSKRASALLHHTQQALLRCFCVTASSSLKRRNNDDARKEVRLFALTRHDDINFIMLLTLLLFPLHSSSYYLCFASNPAISFLLF